MRATIRSITLGAALALAIGTLLAPAAAQAEVDKKTERLWKSKCGSCHGQDGKGQTKKGQEMKVNDMTTAEYQKKFSDADLKKAINEGVNKTEGGVKKEMDGFKDDLSAEQLDGLVAYIRSLKAK